MAEYLIKDATLIEIANAIRNKADKTDKIPVSKFAKEINELKAGGNPPNLDETLPADASVIANTSVVCNVLILGDYDPADYSFQWYVNNTAVIGATGTSYTIKPTSIGTTTVYCNVTNSSGTTSSRVATITSRSTIPKFTYTGSYQVVNDSNSAISSSTDNWKIRFLTSGTLTFTELNGAANGIDVFLVGGGGGGSTYRAGYIGRAGGGGGYTGTVRGLGVTLNAQYGITIGAGGAGDDPWNNGGGGAGGTTSAFNHAVGGGGGGGDCAGGNGGSGGGAGSWYSMAGNGGADGGAGSGFNASNGGAGGAGQGSTTREFGESSGNLYAGGGGGYGGPYSGREGAWVCGAGGSGGGGNGGGGAGVSNTGGGGGGGGDGHGGWGGSGGSGIVIIRNKR